MSAKIANAKVTLPLPEAVAKRAEAAVGKIDNLPDDKAIALATLLNAEGKVRVKFSTTNAAAAKTAMSSYTSGINSSGELEPIENGLGRI